MSRKKGERSKDGRHVRLYHSMLRSAAWQNLNGNERAIYIEIASRYAGTNNGRLFYSVRDAAQALHIGKTTASKALARLQELGFIEATSKGAFSLKARHATEWRITEFACDVTNRNPTREFANWGKQNTVPDTALSVPYAGPIGTRYCTEHS